MTLRDLLQFGIILLALPQPIALARAWALLRKGRTWFAWIGGLTSILALWVVVVGWLFISLISEGNEGVVSTSYLFWFLFSVPALLIDFLVFSGLFLGLRALWRRRAGESERLVKPTL